MTTVNRTGIAASIANSRLGITDSGACFNFDGIDGKITEASTASFSSSTAVTMCGRIKLLADSTDSYKSQPVIGTKWCYVQVRLIGGQHTLIIRYDDGSARQAGQAINKSQWYSFVATMSYNGTNTIIKMYIDGVSAGVLDTAGLPTTERVDFIGNIESNYFTGRLDDLMVFNREFTAEEALMYHRNRIAGGTGCVLYYKANEGSGTTATDSSGIGNTGTLVGGVTYVTDKVFSYSARRSATRPVVLRNMYKSLFFNGTSDKLTLPIAPATTGFNVAFWLNTYKSTTLGPILSWSTDGATTGFIIYYHSSFQSVFLQMWDGSLVVNMGSNGGAALGKWNHFAITFVPNSAVIYLNGSQTNLDLSCSMATATGQTLTVAKRSYANTWGGMYINNLVWKNSATPWTAAEVSRIYQAGINPSGSTGIYNFNDAVTDSSGNGNDGTLTGGSYSTNVPFKPRTVL